MILTLQVIRIDIVYTDWGWNKSPFAQHYFWPLMAVGFIASTVAPLFGSSHFSKRLKQSIAAFLFAALLYGGSSVVVLFLYGA